MKFHLRHVLYYKSFFLASIFTFSASFLKPSELNWVVVTSEADSGPGTLREAIETINSGSKDFDAIAFANNVQTIFLQSNLPTILNPVVIDGLAVVDNGSVTREGNCDVIPSPVDNPQGFSASIRVTIDGTDISSAIIFATTWGINAGSTATIRGLRIKNVASFPTEGGHSIGIFITSQDTNNLVECCEIEQIHNTANTGDPFFVDHRSVGIETQFLSNNTTVSKCYVHNINGGSIFTCDSQLESGNSYGIINCQSVRNSRIECISSGNINVSCNDILRATVGRAVGIAYGVVEPDPSSLWPCQGPEKHKQNNHQRSFKFDSCNGSEGIICIQNNLICNIQGGSTVTNQPEVFQTEVAGILLGSPFNDEPLTQGVLVENNTINVIQNGSADSSGDNSINISLGSFGILLFGAAPTEDFTIRYNTIETITNASSIISGEKAAAFPGYTYGIWNQIESGNLLTEYNTILNVYGATTTANGTCSTIADDINSACGQGPAKHTPGGVQCAENHAPIVAGIIAKEINITKKSFTINNNNIENIRGGKRVAVGFQSSISSVGAAGIFSATINNPLTTNHNTIKSVIGTELAAKQGGVAVIKQEGTNGICLFGQIINASSNHVELVCEGRVQAAYNSLGVNLTDIFFGLLNRSYTTATKHLEEDTALPYAPVITSGIAVSPGNIENLSSRACISLGPWHITENTVKTVVGSTVTGGTQPLGSIAVGMWLQPILTLQRTARSFESCTIARQNNDTNGSACNNNISNITGGTNVPAYGIFLDGSAQFFARNTRNNNRESTFFTLDQNSISNIFGSKKLPVFELDLFLLTGNCPGTSSFEKTAFPFLPFEPTSGIYTLFGGCSTLSGNTITEIKSFNSDARGITTAASSDMLITENSCSKINGYGIFVGGLLATIDSASDLGTDMNNLTLEDFASVRNKIHTNSTINNTKNGIKLGRIDWSNALFGINRLNVCPIALPDFLARPLTPSGSETYISIYGNHGQIEPCLTKVVCNRNGTITVDIRLQNTHRLTSFTVQFFRNNSQTVQQGVQALSNFDDPQFVVTTDFNGNAFKRFTFIPEVKIQDGDTITAHVTVNDLGQAAVSDQYFCDTSEFGCQLSAQCIPKILVQKQTNKPSNQYGFCGLLKQ